jgi:hypothetical protein
MPRREDESVRAQLAELRAELDREWKAKWKVNAKGIKRAARHREWKAIKQRLAAGEAKSVVAEAFGHSSSEALDQWLKVNRPNLIRPRPGRM